MGLFIAGLLLATTAGAQQLSFDLDRGKRAYTYTYTWKDDSDQEFEATFELPADAVQSELETKNGIDHAAWHAHAAAAVRQYATTLPEGVTLEVTSDNNSVEVAGSGPKEAQLVAIMEEAERVQDTAAEAWLVERYFRRVDSTTVSFDHPRLTVRYVEAVRPIAAALAIGTKGPRSFANRAIQFVQGLPYEKRKRADAGYRRPYQLLTKNRGDCDSKTVLFLAMMRAQHPDVPLGIAYVTDHALGVVGIPAHKGDATVTAGGVKWVLAEVVGPAVHPLGEIGKHTTKHARNLEIIPVPKK